MRLPKPSPPNVLIGGPVRIPPGFPLKACGNDGLVGELEVEGYTSFLIPWGERKLMTDVVREHCGDVCLSHGWIELPRRK